MIVVTALSCLALGGVAAGVATAVDPPEPRKPGAGTGTKGLYLLNSKSKVDPTTTTAWVVDWEVPRLDNFDEARGAVGQWYFDFESGFYKTDGRWGVYYYSDENGPDNGDPDCSEQTWEDGRICGGELGDLQPGQKVRFFYQLCQNDQEVCLWVDIFDGKGLRYLAKAEKDRNTSGGWDMYAHDIETFEDSDRPRPVIACDQPTKMIGQQYQKPGGSWVTMTGDLWEFEDRDANYKYQNVDTAASPATWESCSG